MYYVAPDSNGNIVERYDTSIASYTIPSNAVEITEAQWNDSMQNPGKYIVQNGSLVLAPAPTQAEQLASAQQAQIATLEQSYADTLAKGYTSNATGTAYTYSLTPSADLAWRKLKDAIDLGAFPSGGYPLKCVDANGNTQYINHTQVQASQVLKDGASFELSEDTTLRAKIGDVEGTQLANYSTLQDAITAVQALTY